MKSPFSQISRFRQYCIGRILSLLGTMKFPFSQIPGFRQYCIGQILSLLGTGMQCSVLFWYVQSCTNSAFDTTVVFLVNGGAMFLLLPVGGVFADKHDRWNILIISQVVALLQATALGFIALTGAFSLWSITPLSALAGGITGFDAPARRRLKSDLADEKSVDKVIRFYDWIDKTAFTAGFAIGGILIVALPRNTATICFFVNAASYLAALWALLAVRPRGTAKAASKSSHSEPEQGLPILEGLRLICSSWTVFLPVFQTAVVVVFCNRLDPLLPAFAEDGLRNIRATGWLEIAKLVGFTLGGLWMHRYVTKESQLRWSYRTLTALSVVLLIMFTFAREPISASLAMAVASAALLVQGSCGQAVMEISVAPAMRGRVNSWRGSMYWGLDTLVGIPSGWAATSFGVCPVLIAYAAMGTVIALCLWLFAAPRKGAAVSTDN